MGPVTSITFRFGLNTRCSSTLEFISSLLLLRLSVALDQVGIERAPRVRLELAEVVLNGRRGRRGCRPELKWPSDGVGGGLPHRSTSRVLAGYSRRGHDDQRAVHLGDHD